jgi:low affinity Fe/Cu permease
MRSPVDKLFAKFANGTAKVTGSPPAFLICVAMVLLWAVSGPIFKFSETWQLVINTGTTIVTFLMVFLIQNTQNRDGRRERIHRHREADGQGTRGDARPLQGAG